MTNELVFDTEAEANAAVKILNNRMGFSDPRTATMTFAVPQQRLDGKWTIPLPYPDWQSWLAAVPYTVEEKQDDWFPPPPDEELL